MPRDELRLFRSQAKSAECKVLIIGSLHSLRYRVQCSVSHRRFPELYLTPKVREVGGGYIPNSR